MLVVGQDSEAGTGDGAEPVVAGGSGTSARALSGGGVRGLLAAAGISVKRRSIVSLAASAQQQNPSTDGGMTGGSGGGSVSPGGLRLTGPGAASQLQAEEGMAHRAASATGKTPPGARSSSRMVLFANRERRNSVGPRERRNSVGPRERLNSTDSAPVAAQLVPPQPSPPPVIADEVSGVGIVPARVMNG
jgi:hypothetical protein